MTNFNRRLIKVGIHFGLIAFTAFLLFPLLWVLSTSFKPTPEIYHGTPAFRPATFSLVHYQTLLRGSNILLSMRNSLTVGLLATVLVVIVAMPGAYALTRFRSALNKTILGWILTSQIFPAILIMIPLYVTLRNLKLTDSLFGLALVYVVWSLPFVLWMLHGYLKNIPVDLEEAAALDGATTRQIIFRVILPTLLPAAVTLPVELARYTGMEGQARTGPLAAASVLATMPSLVLFGAMQKWFASGLLSGAVKD